MKINVVCTDRGWIFDQFVDAFRKYSKHDVIKNAKVKCDLYHYLPYWESPKPKHMPHPCTSWHTHQERKSPLHEKFISSARAMDYVISHSKKYADMLRSMGISNVKQVMPGVDLEKFIIRDKPKRSSKLIVGYNGRSYQSSGRKNPALIKKISELPFVDFRATGGKMKLEDIPKHYSGCDLVLSPSVIEAGPMAIQESLMCGVPIICFEGVGVADEFNTGVIKVPFGNSHAFLDRIKKFHDNCEYEHYDSRLREQMRAQVKSYTWQNFVAKHDAIWSEL